MLLLLLMMMMMMIICLFFFCNQHLYWDWRFVFANKSLLVAFVHAMYIILAMYHLSLVNLRATQRHETRNDDKTSKPSCSKANTHRLDWASKRNRSFNKFLISFSVAICSSTYLEWARIFFLCRQNSCLMFFFPERKSRARNKTWNFSLKGDMNSAKKLEWIG